MSRYLFVLLWSCMVVQGMYAQDRIDPNIKEKPVYRVFYQHEHLRDTSKSDNVYQQNMVLVLGDRHSQFFSFDKLIEYKNTEQGMFAEFKAGNRNVKLSAGKINIPEEIILSYTSDAVLINTYMAHYCHYHDVLPEVKWDIKDSTKSIEGIECTLATTSYLGRDWEAWFSLDFPYPSGPWFLRGLPGVILEAKDFKNEVLYRFLRIESATVENEIIDYQKDKYKFIALTNKEKNEGYSKQQYNDQLALARKDVGAIFRYMSEKYDFNVYGTLIDYGLTNHYSWSRIIPNPIDLERE